MTDTALHELSMASIAGAVQRGELSAVAIARHYLDRIHRHDPAVHAYLHIDAEGALAQAAAIDRARAQGEALGLLAGVPLAVKDNLCTRGVPTTAGSRILAGYVPPYDATVIERLRVAGAVILGKLNLDEFAMGSSNENSAFGPVHNPYALDRTPGGSSGGAAAATAARLVAGALGSDTGGSVRQPGAYCGVTALKPSYGRVSRHGLIAFASSLDQVGPLARSARDAARVLSVIAGADPRDATSVPAPTDDYEAACGREVRGLRVGVVRDALGEGTAPEVRAAVESAVSRLADLGCQVVDVALPHARYSLSVYYVVASAEASSNLARFDGMRYGLRVRGEDMRDTYRKTRAAGFGAEVKRRIMLGTYALSAGYYDAFYLKAQKVRTLIRDDYARAFERSDLIVGPTAPTAAFRLGEKTHDPLVMYMQDVFTLPPSVAGVPAISTPCGRTAEGLPIGLQIVAPFLHEARLVQVADALERVTAPMPPPGFAATAGGGQAA